jgi:hypothetical protein
MDAMPGSNVLLCMPNVLLCCQIKQIIHFNNGTRQEHSIAIVYSTLRKERECILPQVAASASEHPPPGGGSDTCITRESEGSDYLSSITRSPKALIILHSWAPL